MISSNRHRFIKRAAINVVAALAPLTLAACLYQLSGRGEVRLRADGQARWYKGNTHTHTLWSDGDAAPEVAVKWYADRDYDFLSLSDHNVISDGDFDVWFPVDGDRLTDKRVAEIRATFGDDWVETRNSGGREQMRLKTLPELKRRFETAGDFLLIQAEEITTRNVPVHVNAIGIEEFISPVSGMNRAESIRAYVEAVDEQSARLGKPMITHIDHPNWSGGVTAEDMIAAGPGRAFEVYNGHGGVRNWGNDDLHMPPTDRLWDIILSMRLKNGREKPMYGFGTDDTHAYFEQRIGLANAGRGWTMVLAAELSENAILNAMKNGRFYASSGVTLREIAWSDESMRIEIEPKDGVNYRVQFIGTDRGFDASSEPARDSDGNTVPSATRVYSDQVGRVLLETTYQSAVYHFTGNELYVRAKIISDKPQVNPHAKGDVEMAWTQPIALN